MTQTEFNLFKTMLDDGNPLKREIKYVELLGEGFSKEELESLSLEECLLEANSYFQYSKEN